MIPLIIITCIIAIIAFLLSIKITLRIKYSDKLTVGLKILFVKIRLYPKKEKKKRYPHSMSKRQAKKIKDSLKRKPKRVKKKKKEKEPKKEEKAEEKADLLTIISIVISFVKSFIRLFAGSIRVKASRLKIVVASEDAAQTALTYTAVTQSVNVLFPLLNGLKAVKRLPKGKDLSVDIDFLSDTPKIDADIELYIRVGGILKAVCGAAINAFKKAVKDQIRRLERKG